METEPGLPSGRRLDALLCVLLYPDLDGGRDGGRATVELDPPAGLELGECPEPTLGVAGRCETGRCEAGRCEADLCDAGELVP